MIALHSRRRRALVPFFVALAASGCSKPVPEAPTRQKVTVATPLEREVVDWDEYVGRFEAIEDVQLRPRVSGTIDRVLFADGQAVRKGQPLFVIDPRPYRATLGQARAQVAKAAATLHNARSEFARAQRLLATQAISREEYEQKQAVVGTTAADLQAAQENVRNALLNLEFTTIRAPVSGRISDRRVSPGNYASAGETVLSRIVSTDPIWFSFDGAESLYLKYMRQARAGERGSSRTAANPVDIQLADEPTYRWRGKMSFVDNTIDGNSGTIRAHAVVSNPDGFLTPGLFGRARLLGSGRYKALLIPDEAILTDQTRRLVYVVGAGGKAENKVVETGPLVERLRVIRRGISARDRVVIEGATLLQPGMEVDSRKVPLRPRAQDTSPNAVPETAPLPSEATAG
ncbi:efflux RND transporter periplasmic adaptor subunit [Allosphingosinicella deserti]|uniref:Efflux transporter periplasmic adaptor subunit n=1 Tax=Allosphingosinicella deserti TaxID=2116704 RepID=A0A2P7QZN5_9SPHN|nr:efflux RND transporter periplasmic adaptor subunit [Sphingomonas deserti]PSJ43427.1 efflux transporter periplasmic adaptor subunit [Sphingomonas deserti]